MAVTASFVLPAVAHSAVWQLLVSALSGAGIGLAFAAMSNAIVDAVPATHTGEATSIVAALALPSACRRWAEAGAVGVDDLPAGEPEPASV